MEQRPFVSIIVPAYNEEDMLPVCLDALLSLDYPKDRLEIIVVDNNSTDKTPEVIKKYPVKSIFVRERNRSVARNAGIRASSGELIAFTDADGIAEAGWLVKLVQEFKCRNIGGAGGKTLSYKPDSFWARYLDWFFFINQYEKTGNFLEDFFLGLIFGTHNVMYRKSVLTEVGAFDESMTASEDIDLTWRVCLKGYQVNYAPEAVVFHKRKASFAALLSEYLEYTYWQYMLVKKYQSIIGLKFNWWLYLLKILRLPLTLIEGLASGKNVKSGVYQVLNVFWDISMLFSGFYGWLTILAGKRFRDLSFVPEKIIWRYEGEDAVMLYSRDKKEGFMLEAMGAAIWEMFYNGMKPEEIVGEIVKEYDVPAAEARGDVMTLLNSVYAGEVNWL